jgi:tetratricopeptide (TPR) repeat protein
MNSKPQNRPESAARLISGLWSVTVLCLASFAQAASLDVKASHGLVTLPTYPWAAVRHPYFRGTDRVNIYPYPMLDFLSRDKTNRTYKTVILENEYLRITFIPELGGRIHEVIDKTTGQPMFYVNHVIKPGLIGQCGAWISGGVEWNTGPQGHTVSCMQPVDVLILPPEKDGSRSVAIGETERIYGTKWTVIVTLRPGRSFIEERIRIYNPTERVRPYYFWNCTAVPNTPGFRFIYPMTLGTDHAAEKFFNWPIHEGKDLSCGTNYQDASSIFAWHCDQDFFGSYNDDLDRGVVAYANHQQLPGKKAWTWGHGSYGAMHQMDLTDDDGPYNEVQTGPLLTQGEVGRLDPCEAVEWEEWWYPVHGLGGFTFATKDLAVNSRVTNKHIELRLQGTADWVPADVIITQRGSVAAQQRIKLTPRKPIALTLTLPDVKAPCEITVYHRETLLASFQVPLSLPARQPPPGREPPRTARELVQAGWQHYLFARFPDALTAFEKALSLDAKQAEGQLGLAFLSLDSTPNRSRLAALAAIEVSPDLGWAHYTLAVANGRLGFSAPALDHAWKATLDPASSVAGRALAAKELLRAREWRKAADALSAAGPWQSDPVCRNRLACALYHLGERRAAAAIASENLRLDPLDSFARCLLWLKGQAPRDSSLSELFRENEPGMLTVAAEFFELGDSESALRVLEDYSPKADALGTPLPHYFAAYLNAGLNRQTAARRQLQTARALPASAARPHLDALIPALTSALDQDPKDGSAALCLGHLLFHIGRYAEGREMWKRAVQIGVELPVANRALGMASLTLDSDPQSSARYLALANEADPSDAIISRDFARVLFSLGDRSDSAEQKKEFTLKARQTLETAFNQGKGRSDFVALLARANNRLGNFAETARLLDSVRITIWEGAREAHDLFEEAHLALGKEHLEAGRAAQALKEFDRALEYPPNLATGRLENTREAHIHYLRGRALAALGRKPEALAAWKLAAEESPSNDAMKEEARGKAREALDGARASP